ncbi:YitT family protein [Gilvibacter sp.]|uniref:YitT family protein n=1 Tax=Gilvibacter sp. TaxID=2729997 RepID=UPI0035BE8525
MNRSLFFEFAQIGIAVILASIGLKAFLLPNGFLDGGVTGIAILISELFTVELSYTLPIITIPFFVIGWFTVSRKILIKSIFSVLLLAVVIHFENFQSITDDKLIISIFGGLFLGAGIGLAIKNGSVLDGSEIFGIYINEKWGISIGRVILAFNIILFGATAFLLSIEVALYSILTYIVTAKAIDFTIEGFEDHVGLMIVSEQAPALREAFTENLGIGMTVYTGSKGFGRRGEKENVEIIHSVINRIDIRRVQRLIDQLDPNAFVIEFDVNNVKGGILRKYLSRKKM